PFGLRCLDAVLLAQPAAQVDGLAAGAAEGELRPLGRALPLHHPVADRAAYPYHRKLGRDSWAIPLPISCPPCPNRRRPWRSCRLYRPSPTTCPLCRTICPRAAPPWPPPCTTRCGSRSGRSRNP